MPFWPLWWTTLPLISIEPAYSSHQIPCQWLWWTSLFLKVAGPLVSLIPAAEEFPPLVKEAEPLWSILEFLRRNPGPGLPIPWFGLWWSLTLMTCRFLPSFLMAPPHAGSHPSPPPVPLMLRPLMVTPLVPPTLKAISAPLASIFGRVLSE